jgi:hypothetical protein
VTLHVTERDETYDSKEPEKSEQSELEGRGELRMEEETILTVYFVQHVARPDIVKGVWSDAFHKRNPH